MKFDISKSQFLKSFQKSTIFKKHEFWVLILVMSLPNLSFKNELFFKIPYICHEFLKIRILPTRPRDLENFILGDFSDFEDFEDFDLR